MKSLPIRFRLTLWYFAMFSSAAVLLCLASLWMLQRSVDQTEYHDLQERAEDVQLVLSHESSAHTIGELSKDLTSIYEFKDDGKYLQVRDDLGNWIFRSKRMIVENPNLPSPDRLPESGEISEFHQGTRYVRVLAYPIAVREKRYSVQTGIALNKSMVLLASFRTKLLLLAPIVFLLAAAGGHAMSRKALMPVAALATEARRISDRNLNTRLHVSDAQDEISDLSRTLNQMLERIDKAFASVRSFTGNASHELRTPLALLCTELEVTLLRPRTGVEYRETLKRMQEETAQMTNIVENLLSLARADGGADSISLVPTQLDSLLRSAVERWKGAAVKGLLDLHVEMPSADLFVLCDQEGIQRLLSILLENAVKYTPSGGMVLVSAVLEGERILISVKDTGIGIPLEHRDRIFDRFFRCAPNSGGSGLGLALAKWIADCHGAELRVESEPGAGSCFSFSLQGTISPPRWNAEDIADTHVVLVS